MNLFVNAAAPAAAPVARVLRQGRRRLGKLLLLGAVAKMLILVAGLGGGLELLRAGLSPFLHAAQAKAPGAHHPSPPTAD